MAGAAIVDLTFDGALRLTEPGDPEFKPGRLVRTTQARRRRASGRGGRAVAQPQAQGRGRPDRWDERVEGPAGGLKDAVLDDLVAEGVLTHEQGKVLGLFPTNAWPLARPEVEREILDRVRAAVVTRHRAGRADLGPGRPAARRRPAAQALPRPAQA